jgi:hypothetical protein
VLGRPPPLRTEKERENSRIEAKARLIISIPNDFKRIVGGQNCRQGTLRVFEMLQHPVLNKRLLYALLEVRVEVCVDLRSCVNRQFQRRVDSKRACHFKEELCAPALGNRTKG